ncbi:hypothetical protein QBC37DRAFT_369823 [Rhypophila decipiens]|uniref:Uncharacterized protein n=1 Tax=Rhypophila decipiens TaxID=261697 RepID=A0AAN7BBJ4_9PEZI|nr:hypothetical protein QBC37DRAFT_369823 [Rhypophila decipiens]
MEQVRAARRSASHGSMNRRYAADTGFSPGTVDSNPFTRRPLRSVNENTCLLNRPGPLESMLKTTTETGDIGLFSIRPSRSTTNFHRPLYAQSDSGDENWQTSPRGNMIDTPTFRHDSRRTPRPRDTASEIVSMHGSTSQRSASSTFSQPLDDPAQRTYSMTSCSSRPMSSKKSNGTLQSQSSGTFLQRPRSPFPYPARLRRPGMRPSSPAWTDNGAVDYSRMIQIDRIPHRTVHDLRKPTYPHSSRRATPGLTRPDANRSMSLSSASSLSVAEMSTGRISAAPTISGSEYRGRLDRGKSNNSLTSSSPTSIGGMHRPPYPRPVQNHSSRAQSSGVLFYDYTEQFEEAPPVVKPPLSPLAPIPTRAPSLHRHMLLDERYTLRFRDANIQNVTTVLRDSSPTELDSEQKSPKNQQNLLSPTKTLLDASSRLFPDPPMDPRAYRSSEDTEQGPPQEGTRPSHKSAAPSSGFMAASTSDIGRLQSPPAKCTRQQPEAMEVKIDLGAKQDKTDWRPFSPMSLERYDMTYKECLQHSALPQRSSVPESGDIHRSMSLSCETRESPSYVVSGLRDTPMHVTRLLITGIIIKTKGRANHMNQRIADPRRLSTQKPASLLRQDSKTAGTMREASVVNYVNWAPTEDHTVSRAPTTTPNQVCQKEAIRQGQNTDCPSSPQSPSHLQED